jgi:hypothetical protein
MDKQNAQFDTFRIQLQQKLNDIDTTLNKIQSTTTKQQLISPDIVIQKTPGTTPIPSRRPSVIGSMEQLGVPQQGLLPVTTGNQTMLLEEIARLRELIEEKITGQPERITTTGRPVSSISSVDIATHRPTMIVPPRQQPHVDTHAPLPVIQPYPQDIGQRVTDLQLAVNRLHQDVSAIRQVVERMSPLSASLILGRTAGLK